MGKKLVLLVDDNVDIRESLEEFLEDRNYDVIPASTGKQALDFLNFDAQSPPDVVVLDLLMPIVTGWQVLDTMKHDPRLAGVPVVVLTGAERDRPGGAAAVLQKPISPEMLQEVLDEVIARKENEIEGTGGAGAEFLPPDPAGGAGGVSPRAR